MNTLINKHIKHYICILHDRVFCVPEGEIALLEGLTVVYKSNIDLFFYVIGSSHENEVRHFLESHYI